VLTNLDDPAQETEDTEAEVDLTEEITLPVMRAASSVVSQGTSKGTALK